MQDFAITGENQIPRFSWGRMPNDGNHEAHIISAWVALSILRQNQNVNKRDPPDYFYYRLSSQTTHE